MFDGDALSNLKQSLSLLKGANSLAGLLGESIPYLGPAISLANIGISAGTGASDRAIAKSLMQLGQQGMNLASGGSNPMMSLIMGLDAWMTAKEQKDRADWVKPRMGHIKENSGIFKQLGTDLSNVQSGADFKNWLNSDFWGGERAGDVIANIVNRNLRGDYVEGQNPQGSGWFQWEPNEQFKPLAAGLKSMGYGNETGRDPSTLIGYSGGWQPQKDKYGLPTTVDFGKGIGSWNKGLASLSDIFTKINPQWSNADIPVMSKPQMFDKLYQSYKSDPYQASLAYGLSAGEGGSTNESASTLQSKYAGEALQGLSEEQIAEARRLWEEQQQILKAYQSW